jgi:hypothetical protein
MSENGSKKLAFRGGKILELSTEPTNAHKIHLQSSVSYPTVHNMLARPEAVQRMDLTALYKVLSAGLGLSDDEILNLKLGDLFSVT